MDDALIADDILMINELFEAALSMPIRMRCAPSYLQNVKDTLSVSEDLHNGKEASADAWIDFVPKARVVIDAALGAGNYKTASVSTIQAAFEKAKIQFHGKPIGDHGVRAFLAVDCFEEDKEVRCAIKALETVTKELNEPTKIKDVCLTCTKYHGAGTKAALGACANIFKVLRIASTHKAISFHREFLVGKGHKQAGFVQFSLKKSSHLLNSVKL